MAGQQTMPLQRRLGPAVFRDQGGAQRARKCRDCVQHELHHGQVEGGQREPALSCILVFGMLSYFHFENFLFKMRRSGGYVLDEYLSIANIAIVYPKQTRTVPRISAAQARAQARARAVLP
jgi:hypothetical protein